MDVIGMLSILCGVLLLFSVALLFALLKSSSRIIEINKQLLIVVAGKEAKPETLRALVASNKPPQGNLKGIANEKVKKKNPVNMDYTLTIGEGKSVL